MRSLMLFLPIELVPLLIIAAGLAMILGARAAGRGLLMFTAAILVLPALLAPLFEMLPDVLLCSLMVGMVLALAFQILGWVASALIGREPANAMIGILAADFVRGLIRGIARATIWPVRLLARGLLSIMGRR